jgi:hypothetical protein
MSDEIDKLKRLVALTQITTMDIIRENRIEIDQIIEELDALRREIESQRKLRRAR